MAKAGRLEMKFLSTSLIALASVAALASPSMAQNVSTVSVKPGLVISAVSDSSEIQTVPIPGGNVGFEANPSFFAGAQLCVSGLGANWAIKRDGTLDTRDPARRMSCAPISASGQASVRNPFGPDAVPVILLSDGRIVWAGRDRLTGLSS